MIFDGSDHSIASAKYSNSSRGKFARHAILVGTPLLRCVIAHFYDEPGVANHTINKPKHQ
jgi:hypothetical protein